MKNSKFSSDDENMDMLYFNALEQVHELEQGPSLKSSKSPKKVVMKKETHENILYTHEPSSLQHKIDLEAYKTWIYPTQMQIRDYQYNMVQKALFTNTLIALPTGLGNDLQIHKFKEKRLLLLS